MTKAHGDPIWIDLSTHDLPAATDFYSLLFGWEFTDQGEEYGHYHFASLDGRPVAGLMSSLMGPDGPLEEPDAPTVWGVAFSVDDLDDVLTKVGPAGGSVEYGPMDVGPLGRMAHCLDGTGAYVVFWEPGEFTGFPDDGAPGIPFWFELMARDFDSARRFYSEALGWKLDTFAGETRYAANGTDETATAGISDAGAVPAEAGSYWRAFVPVADLEKSTSLVTQLGGSLLDDPVDTPFGRVVTIADPQGASLKIIQRA